MTEFDKIEVSKYHEIEKNVFKSYKNKGLPINIIDLAEKYKIKTVNILSEKSTYKVSVIPTKALETIIEEEEYFKGYDFVIAMTTKDALEQRMCVAYQLATILLFTNELISPDKTISRLMIKNEIPTDSSYVLALSLLCPSDKVYEELKKYGYNENNYKEITDYSEFTKGFLVSSNDFAFRLKVLFEGDDENAN